VVDLPLHFEPASADTLIANKPAVSTVVSFFILNPNLIQGVVSINVHNVHRSRKNRHSLATVNAIFQAKQEISKTSTFPRVIGTMRTKFAQCVAFFAVRVIQAPTELDCFIGDGTQNTLSWLAFHNHTKRSKFDEDGYFDVALTTITRSISCCPQKLKTCLSSIRQHFLRLPLSATLASGSGRVNDMNEIQAQ